MSPPMPDLVPLMADLNQAAERLWATCAPHTPGLALDVVAETASTNTALMDQGRRGDTWPTAMVAVRRLILDVAESPVDVLVHGETGCGKELVAQALHAASPRRKGPYVALNCGGMPDNLLDSDLFGHEAGAFTGAQKRRIGKIEHAHGGTAAVPGLHAHRRGVLPAVFPPPAPDACACSR